MSEASKGGKLKFEWTDKEGYTQIATLITPLVITYHIFTQFT